MDRILTAIGRSMKKKFKIFAALCTLSLLYTLYLLKKSTIQTSHEYAENIERKCVNCERQSTRSVVKYPALLKSAKNSQTELYNRVGTVVLVMAYYRSGSSFFGQLFNKNPEAFYLFEPLLPFTPKCDRLYEERLELLTNISKCDFRGAPSAYELAHSVTGYEDKNIECISTNICFNKQLSVSDSYYHLCTILHNHFNGSANENDLLKLASIAKEDPRTEISTLQNLPTSCKKPFNITLESAICQTSKIVAYKILRVCDFKRLEEVYEKLTKQGSDVYVIHLVRDPRAMIYSGLQLEIKKSTLKNHTTKLCSHLRSNLQYIKNSANGNGMVSHEKVLQIRYEDMAANTATTVQTVYDFIGHEFNEHVRQWLLESAVRPGAMLVRYRRQLSNPSLTKQQRIQLLDKVLSLKKEILDPYGTARNPNYVLMKWRKNMAYEITKLIQEECRDVMELLGYKTFKDAQEQIDMSHRTW